MKKKKLFFPIITSLMFTSFVFTRVSAVELKPVADEFTENSTNQILKPLLEDETLTTQTVTETTAASEAVISSSTDSSTEETSEAPAEEPIEQSTEITRDKVKAKKGRAIIADDGYTLVTSNADFESALAANTPKIRLAVPLAFDRSFTITYDVVIDFQNLDHKTQNNHIYLNEKPTTVEFQNFKMTAPDPASVLGANQDENAMIVGFATDWVGARYHFRGKLLFTGSFNIYGASKLSTLYIPQGIVTLDGVTGNIDIAPVTEGLYAAPGKCYFARVYRLEIINGSQLTAPYLGKFYGRLTAASEKTTSSVNSGLFVSSGSKIMVSYDRADSVRDEGEIIDTLASNVFFQIEDPGTEFNIQTQIDITSDDNRGIVQMRGEASRVNVNSGAKLQINSKTTAAFRMEGKDSQINVKSGGNIQVTMEHDKDIAGNNGMRFVGSGLMLLIDGEGSSVNIKKASGKSPAVRFENGNQTLKVTNGASLVIHNVGDGHEYSNRVSQGNQAILFDDTTGWFNSPGPASFTVEGEKANIDIRADSGATVDTTGDLDLNFSASEKTYLVMVGKTGKDKTGIISGNKLTVNVQNPMYFDFQNRRVGNLNTGIGGWVFQGNGSSSLTINQSEIALWRKNEAHFNNFDQDPKFFSDITDLNVVGTDLGTVSSSTSSALLNEFNLTASGMKGYNRISANNQIPVVDSLRVPTNADKKIYGHISVPEGLEAQLRDAWTDEVEVVLQLTYADASKEPVQFTARTVGQIDGEDGLDPWGEGRQGGLFEIPVPDNQYLATGDTIQVLSAKKVRGAHDLVELDTAKTTVDIIPPDPAALTTKTINPKTTEISGTGEIGADVLLMRAGTELLASTLVDEQGEFTLSIPEQILALGDQLEIVLRDKAGDAASQGVINKPNVNDRVGNFNPLGTKLEFHDATFLPATKVVVEGFLFFEAPDKIDFGSLKATGMKVEAVGQTEGALLIYDQRHTKQDWALKVKESEPLTVQQSDGSAQALKDTLYFASENDDYHLLTSEVQTVATGKANSNAPVDLSALLSGRKGFKTILSGNQQIPGQYSAEITWVLEDAPQK